MLRKSRLGQKKWFSYKKTCTRITKLKPLLYKQKQPVRIVFNEGRLSHSKPLFKVLNALNVYKINLYQHLNFMYRLGNRDIPAIFNDIVKKTEHKYPTKFSSLNYTLITPSVTNVDFQFLSEDQNCGMKSSIKKKKRIRIP